MSNPTKHVREDDVDEQLEKKKRRVVTPVKSEKVANSDKVDPKMQTARILFNTEENEVLMRDADEDVEIHKDVLNEIQSIMAKIKAIKRSNMSDEKKKENINKLRYDAILHFVSLKKLNRVGHLRSKRIREQTQEAKQKVDQKQLSLQNLLYELMHLQREISKCVQFKSMDEEISLVTEDEFLKVIPKEMAEELLKEKDDHKMMMARLDWELKERKTLSAKYSDSLKTKEAIQVEIQKLKMSLKNLSPMLSNVLESMKPIQEHLELPFQENEKRQKQANFLPPPLYFLFVQASSYGRACDKDVTVEIVGDVELAQSIEKFDSPIDEEGDDSEDESEQTNKIHRRSTDSLLTKKQEQILKRHPLSINLKINSGEVGSVTLNFQYFVNLEFVVASSTIHVNHDLVDPNARQSSEGTALPSASQKLMDDLFKPLVFLDCLYEGDDDDGGEIPDPENVFKLAKFGITDLDPHLKDVGRPFRWVQRLCGLQNVVPLAPTGDSNPRKRWKSYIEELIELIKTRFTNRLELLRQINVLDGTNEKPAVNWMAKFNFTNVPKKISSQLVQWRSTTYDEFVKSSISKNILQCELACDKDFFYHGVIERTTSINSSQPEGGDGNKATLTFFVVINPDYPNSLPLFCTKVNWGTIEKSSQNAEDIRELESSVNLRSATDLDPKNALLNQVALLSTCFDVYLETGGLAKPRDVSTNPFEGDKSYLRLTRGPTRSKPYRYVSKLGFFSHY